MADTTVGQRVPPIPLVTTRGRDFKWAFTNLNDNDVPEDFPAGDLFFELQTGGQHNAVQKVTTLRANGGAYELGTLGETSDALTFDDESEDVQAALAEIVGAGNVEVTGRYYPQWILTVTLTGAAAPTLPRNVQNLVEAAVKEVLDGLEFLGAGRYDLESHYAPPTWTFTCTDRIGMEESDWLTYLVDIINTSVQTAIRAIGGVLNSSTVSVSEFYTPKREFRIEYVNELANTPMPKLLTANYLTGSSPAIEVEVEAPGKDPLTLWHFEVDGSLATIKVESEETDKVRHRTKWQLVFLPEGEPAGGDLVARGTVEVQQ